MSLLILRDLQFRRVRVGLTMILIAIVVTLLFIMSGMVNQFTVEPELATTQTAGDLNWIVSEGTGGPFTSPRPIDPSRFDEVSGEPIFMAPASMNGTRTILVGHTFKASGLPELTTGRYPSKGGEVVTDETAGLTVGDGVLFGEVRGVVVGTTSGATVLAGVPLSFATLDFSRQIAVGGRDLLVAKVTNETAETAQELPSGLKLMTANEVSAVTRVPLAGAIASVTLIQVLLWMITVIVIAAVIYITALERTRDFALLKAVGGTTRDLAASLLLQGVVMTLLAVGLAGLLQHFLAPIFPLTIRVPPSAWFTITIGATAASLVAGAAGVLRVRSTPPTEAFG